MQIFAIVDLLYLLFLVGAILLGALTLIPVGFGLKYGWYASVVASVPCLALAWAVVDTNLLLWIVGAGLYLALLFV